MGLDDAIVIGQSPRDAVLHLSQSPVQLYPQGVVFINLGIQLVHLKFVKMTLIHLTRTTVAQLYEKGEEQQSNA